MVTQSQRDKFQTLMRGTIISLCQNVLDHKSEIKVEVFIGITLDKKQDFHFSVVETLRADAVTGSTEVAKPVETSATTQATPAPPRSSMLERLMTNDISPGKQSNVPTAPPPKGREVSSSTPSADKAQNLSYSELLRSFGEMSRHDNTGMPSNLTASCPTLFNTLNSSSTRRIEQSPVNQAQVVIPINFAIHSPSNHANRSQESFDSRNTHWHGNSASVTRNKKARYDGDAPDSTYSDKQSHKSDDHYGQHSQYNIKVKEEVLSDEEIEQDVDNYHGYRQSYTSPQNSSDLLVELQRQALEGQGMDAQDTSPHHSPSNEPAASSRGILMSLLCEKSPGIKGKKRGRPKKKAEDPPYTPSSNVAKATSGKVTSDTARRGAPDNRVLIGLTDYLPGFKQGDLNQEKPPKCVFSSQDISAKTRKIILLNSGPFSSVRMVHRSLQGMRASEISDVMREMTRPRQHPEYVGEYKAITMPKVRQGRKMVGVFYKCPPEIILPEALKPYDIDFDDYIRFFNQVFKYDRTPQPQYFESVEMFSPFYGTFGGERRWRGNPVLDPTLTLDQIHELGNTLDPIVDPSVSDGQKKAGGCHDMTLQISGIKSEQADWESVPEEVDNDDLAMPDTSTQQWSRSADPSPAPRDDRDYDIGGPTPHSDSPERSTPSPDDYNTSAVTFTPPDFGSQPVFPQPLVIPGARTQDNRPLFPEPQVVSDFNTDKSLFPHQQPLSDIDDEPTSP